MAEVLLMAAPRLTAMQNHPLMEKAQAGLPVGVHPRNLRLREKDLKK